MKRASLFVKNNIGKIVLFKMCNNLAVYFNGYLPATKTVCQDYTQIIDLTQVMSLVHNTFEVNIILAITFTREEILMF